MNFQGPRDLTPVSETYRKVVAFLIIIQNNYPEIFENLRRAPQFEYEVEVCRFKKAWARRYLGILKKLVKDYVRVNHTATDAVELRQGRVPVFVQVYNEQVVHASHPWEGWKLWRKPDLF